MEARELLAYADWSRAVLKSTVEANAETWDREIETLSNFKSIRALTAHIAAAEERWVMRILGKPRPDPGYEDRAGSSIDEVFKGWDSIRAATHAVVSKASDSDLSAVHHISLPHWGLEFDRSVEQMLFQVFNHQTYHIGQISMSLQRWGIDPPNFDAIFAH